MFSIDFSGSSSGTQEKGFVINQFILEIGEFDRLAKLVNGSKRGYIGGNRFGKPGRVRSLLITIVSHSKRNPTQSISLIYHRVGQESLFMIGFFGIAQADISRVWGSSSVATCMMFKIVMILVSLGFGSQIEKMEGHSRFFGEALRFHFTILGNSF
jgi:hypothetical protein